MINGRHLLYLVVFAAGSAFAQGGYAQGMGSYYGPQMSQGYGMGGAAGGCPGMAKQFPKAIKDLVNQGAKLEGENDKIERDLNKQRDLLDKAQENLDDLIYEQGNTFESDEGRNKMAAWGRSYTVDAGCKSDKDNKIPPPSGGGV